MKEKIVETNKSLEMIDNCLLQSTNLTADEIIEIMIGRKAETKRVVKDLNQAIAELTNILYEINKPERWGYSYYLNIPSYSGVTGRIKLFIKKCIRKIIKPIIEPLVAKQISFNAEMVNAVNNLSNCVKIIADSLPETKA